MHLDAGIATICADAGASETGFGHLLGLDDPPDPSEVSDAQVNHSFARALDSHLAALPPAQRVGLRDISVAVLRDAQDEGGALRERLAGLYIDVGALLARLSRSVAGSTASAQHEVLSPAAAVHLGLYEALRQVHPDVPVGGDADGALWAALGLLACRAEGRFTLAPVLTRVVLRLQGERVSRVDIAAVRRAFGVTGEVDPIPVERIADLSSHPLLVQARHVRDRVEPGESVHLRHLIAAGFEQRSGPRGARTRAEDVRTLQQAFLRQIGTDAEPDVATRWRAHFADEPGRRRAAVVATAGPSGRAVAGHRVDLVDDRTVLGDELNVVDDVVTLCDVLAAKDAPPPISVGLFGRWGSGKSYFMALMRRRIDEIRLAASHAKENGGETAYCTEIVQVTFNAWHYMDADDLWATLAVHLFGAIAQIDPDDDSARPRADVVRELEQREREMETVDRKITRVLGDRRVDAVAERMGVSGARADMLRLLHEVGRSAGLVAAVRVLLTARGRSRGRRWWGAGLGVLLLALVVLGALMISGVLPAGVLVAWVPAAATVLATGATWLHRITEGLEQLNRIAAESGLEPEDLTVQRVARDDEVRALRAELEALDRLSGMREFVQARALSADYTRHFGVISVLRGDLEALVEKQRRDAPDRRIILYIDDLDRCAPARVVEVLQAVHLLLAFPLFVVVVGVDPRWLLGSLERHYRRVLSVSDGGSDPLTGTTPHDYLEKIFQIPFSLRPMQREAFGRLISSLTGHTEPAPGSADVPVPPPVTDDLVAPGPPPSRSEDDPAGPAVPVDSSTSTLPGPDAGRGSGSEGEAQALDEVALVSPNPPQLQITAEEVAALRRTAPLIGTPRAAKRLVNLYRLIRAGLADDEVEAFVAQAEFRTLLVVLAAQIGFPRAAASLVEELVLTGEANLAAALDALDAQQSRVDPAGSDRARLRVALRAICVDDEGRPSAESSTPVPELGTRARELRRYSFDGALGRSV
ncbi:P-loop NTPase fold protein [Pseudonocardia lacus]|uniref:P-loop NTPase fold protein n=1 Tax=Pseudonocardia lacus TaxID=2835865 RepID=UPI0020293D7D|nr:P-loop NTPase fold protein [Pseudonocardia lacus]